MSRQYLDARKLLCPMPVIKTQNQVANMNDGEELEVLCTDPGVKNDIPAWARINGHEIIDINEQDGEINVILQVKG